MHIYGEIGVKTHMWFHNNQGHGETAHEHMWQWCGGALSRNDGLVG